MIVVYVIIGCFQAFVMMYWKFLKSGLDLEEAMHTRWKGLESTFILTRLCSWVYVVDSRSFVGWKDG